MNELLIRKYTKQVMKMGVPKLMAQDIVETSYIAGKGKNMDKYIQYAVQLTYGLQYSFKAK